VREKERERMETKRKGRPQCWKETREREGEREYERKDE
jgi:hypothetical protein